MILILLSEGHLACFPDNLLPLLPGAVQQQHAALRALNLWSRGSNIFCREFQIFFIFILLKGKYFGYKFYLIQLLGVTDVKHIDDF